MRKREPRRRVLIPARMRAGQGWVDASIRNISSRGMLIYTPHPVSCGTYVEIRRDTHTIVGRAMWQQGQLLGLFSQDRIDIDAVIAKPGEPSAARACGQPERRHLPRVPGSTGAVTGRVWMMQFTATSVCAVGVALFLSKRTFELFDAPLQTVRTALGG